MKFIPCISQLGHEEKVLILRHVFEYMHMLK